MRIFKIVLDVVMVTLLVGVVVVTPDVHTHGHVFMGMALLPLIVIHVILNRKWIKRVTKVIVDKKANGALRAKYFVIILMLVSWTLVAISSYLAAVSYLTSRPGFEGGQFLLANLDNLDVWEDYIHPWAGRIGGLLVIVHLFQNVKQFKLLFRKK